MKMVAASKLRRAQNSLVATRPYARAMNGLLRHLVTKIDPSVHPLLQSRELTRVLVLVVSGDRGMCGTFNGNIMKAAAEFVHTRYPELKKEQHGIRLVPIGKKISDFCSKRGYDIYARHAGIFGSLNFSYARTIAQELISGYLGKEFDRVEVVYNEFKSVIRQQIVVEQLLPILPEDILKTKDLRSRAQVDYIYEPKVGEIVAALLPRHLNFQLWRILLESSTAEEGARMTAMNNATENAKELIRDLTLSYNKARQAAITKELLEIVSGAEALKRAS